MNDRTPGCAGGEECRGVDDPAFDAGDDVPLRSETDETVTEQSVLIDTIFIFF